MTRATPEQFELRSQRMGALPLLGYFLERMGLAEHLQSYLPRDDARLRLAPAAVIGLLVRSIVVAQRPLYGLAEWAATCEQALLGLEPGDEAALNARLLHPQQGHARIYWAQVERIPTAEALAQLERGVLVAGRRTLPCRARRLDPQPQLPPRDPPIRFRKNVQDCWIELELVEGKNRQVRRMTAAVGHPTLRLMRVRIGGFKLADLPPGQWRELTSAERQAVLS